ncbi:unnamed protein product [Nezara viridula]|uniref:Uncharacterized protein n=1 Tax=Nezara viridula TaxID=85310 RepID=A0A9P0EF42_NEZVI|nr:unnamed protein product [Nezara viridula]
MKSYTVMADVEVESRTLNQCKRRVIIRNGR